MQKSPTYFCPITLQSKNKVPPATISKIPVSNSGEGPSEATDISLAVVDVDDEETTTDFSGVTVACSVGTAVNVAVGELGTRVTVQVGELGTTVAVVVGLTMVAETVASGAAVLVAVGVKVGDGSGNTG